MPVEYTVHMRPKEVGPLSAILDRYIAFRLQMLKDESEHMTLTGAFESTFTRSTWMQRLSNPRLHDFICVAHDTSTHTPRDLESGEWVGTCRLLRPLSRAEYEVPGSGGPDVGSDDEEIRFHRASFYMHPAHRGREATTAMLECVLDFIRCCADEHFAPRSAAAQTYARLRGTLRPDNRIGAFYSAIGYREAGWMTTAEQYKLIDFAEVLAPRDEAPELYEERINQVIEGIIEC